MSNERLYFSLVSFAKLDWLLDSYRSGEGHLLMLYHVISFAEMCCTLFHHHHGYLELCCQVCLKSFTKLEDALSSFHVGFCVVNWILMPNSKEEQECYWKCQTVRYLSEKARGTSGWGLTGGPLPDPSDIHQHRRDSLTLFPVL
jgi:hypothetical protein